MLKYHIQTVELNGASASISFNNIPQDYNDLILTYSVRSNRSSEIDDPVNITFNNSSTGYSNRELRGSGSGNATSSTPGSTNAFGGFPPAGGATSSTFGSGFLYVSNYRSSTNKSISADHVGENNGTTAYQNLIAGLWSDSSAISSIQIRAQVAQWVAGSSASLYGVRRGSDGRTEAASGGVISTSGGYTIHTFNTSGTFVANRDLNVEYLVVAGGAGGGTNGGNGNGGGGGGAGGYRSSVIGESSGGGSSAESLFYISSGTSSPVLVGAGGAGSTSRASFSVSGSNSVFSSITSIGGGGAGGDTISPTALSALSGGSGGGGTGGSGGVYPNTPRSGGSGTANQGFAGGSTIVPDQSNPYGGAGGGGAGGAGTNNTISAGSAGGVGVSSSITGASVTRAIGGKGGDYAAGAAASASANTGSGGAGGNFTGNGGNGGSGVVIIRYLTP
jgi:hypothetical protein